MSCHRAGENIDKGVFGSLCIAEVDWHLMLQGMNVSRDRMNIAHGFHSGNMLRGQSTTLYFWARTTNRQSLDSIALAGMDDSNNMCFHINGRRASIMRHSWVRICLELGELAGGCMAASLLTDTIFALSLSAWQLHAGQDGGDGGSVMQTAEAGNYTESE